MTKAFDMQIATQPGPTMTNSNSRLDFFASNIEIEHTGSFAQQNIKTDHMLITAKLKPERWGIRTFTKPPPKHRINTDAIKKINSRTYK